MSLLTPVTVSVLIGLGVVVAEQMQYSVHGQQGQLVAEAVAGGGGLVGGELRTQHDVAQHLWTGLGSIGAAAGFEFVHRKAHHVGGTGQVHPPHVQIGHRVGVQQHHRQFSTRVDLHLGDDEASDADQLVFGYIQTRFVGNLDSHPHLPPGGASVRPALQIRLFGGTGIGVDDLRHQPVANHVGTGEVAEVDVGDAVEDVHGGPQT